MKFCEALKKPILVVLHQEHSTPGRIGRMLLGRGYSLDLRRPRFGDPLPETLAQHHGAIIFGGPMSANDEDDYVRKEIEWTKVPLKEEKPFFGICLGAQVLARQLGAQVDFHPEGRVEVGYYPMRATEAGKKLCAWPDHVYEWHREGFDLPRDATLLAEGDCFPHQAFQYGKSAFGFQFHSELTHHMMCRWTIRGAARLEMPNAKPRHEHFDDRLVHDPKTLLWLNEFIDLWLAMGEPGTKMQTVLQNAKAARDLRSARDTKAAPLP
jgi:GMP synthase (glutamine-hydrolysing)